MRGNPVLRQKYRAVAAYTGITLAVVGGVMLFSALAAVGSPQALRQAAPFLASGVVAIAGGLAVFAALRPRETILSVQEGGVLVLASWVLACLASAVPLMLAERMNFTQAVFESVSGWTTTGLSVVDVETATRTTLLYRSTMQLVGGAGFAILMLATLIGPTGVGVSGAEGRTDQLVPHVRDSARIVISLYVGYTVLGIAAYLLAGVSFFDSVNNSFAAVSTGGFATYPDSIGHWDSAAVEAVTIVLMILGNLNFLTVYLVVKGRFRSASRSGEVRLFLLLIAVSVPLVLLVGFGSLYPALGKEVRVAVFETVSALTTTGFSTVSYLDWAPLGVLVLILLMIVGGGTCSTAGGLKQHRVYLLAKAVVWELRRLLLPRNAVLEHYVWQAEEPKYVDDGYVRQVGVFTFLYLACLAIGTLVIAAHGYRIDEALFEYASAQGTVGLSLGVTKASAPSLVLWTETAGMFFGRLEFFVIFASIAKFVRDLPILSRRTAT